MTDTASMLPVISADRAQALRRMKRISGGLLLLAAAVYLVCRLVGHGDGAWGYLQAAAEASMVGGLADWFAVTALFRHPLGLPIPHTAIIPTKKDQIGEGLAGFVQQYFLTTEIVSERLAAAKVPQRVGEWLADPGHAKHVSRGTRSVPSPAWRTCFATTRCATPWPGSPTSGCARRTSRRFSPGCSTRSATRVSTRRR